MAPDEKEVPAEQAESKEAKGPQTPASERRSFFGRNSASEAEIGVDDVDDVELFDEDLGRTTKWSMGVLNDPLTHEVPGSVLLLTGQRNEPLGLRNAPARTSTSSLPPQPVHSRRPSRQSHLAIGKKTTPDGAIILEPQPEESSNDPLNWPTWRRDTSLLSLGLYCMVGGGMTPILAAGFSNVASTYHVTVPQVALTTGLYMMGMGIGSVLFSPTAILFGKRPVYLASAIVFIATSVWCAASPSYNSLVVARVLQGVSVSPVECLPSATIAEIFFLHERAYRIGVYTLLLLGGKNLVPLVSAAIIQTLGWRWVFWIVALVVAFCLALLFLFVPESFWDRTPVPKSRKISKTSMFSNRRHSQVSKNEPENNESNQLDGPQDQLADEKIETPDSSNRSLQQRPAFIHRETATNRGLHVEFVPNTDAGHADVDKNSPTRDRNDSVKPTGGMPSALHPHNPNSPWGKDEERNNMDSLETGNSDATMNIDGAAESIRRVASHLRYTSSLRAGPKLSFIQQLKPYNGRLNNDNWLRVAIRPFILFAYPAVLWSAAVYSCAVGWLIVLSESMADVFRSEETYGFSALSTGLIYLSPFIGGILGTVVAGKVSDIIVRFMARRNGGLYEPEFRLVMAIPITIATVIGLIGFGWSAEIHDAWIVPTVFFGIISFGCTLGSTTAITFCVDSYRQYAGEALVTLNFSKNIFHGLVFSLFFNRWLEKSGSKSVFIFLGVIQLVLMAFTVPMYIFGKRARMWTVRKNLMEKF